MNATRRATLLGVASAVALAALPRTAQAGTVTKTIGSAGGRDFATHPLWIASLPANLVTDGNSYVGQSFNDSEFVYTSSSNAIDFTGFTTDASHTITLTTGTGQSFADSASAQTNALAYNVSNGVGVRNNNNYGVLIKLGSNFVTVSKHQLSANGTSGTPVILDVNSSFGNVVVSQCIIESTSSGECLRNNTTTYENVLAVLRGTGTLAWAWQYAGSGASAHGCTVVRPTGLSGTPTAFSISSGTPTVENVAVFGFSTFQSSSGPAYTTCMTDLSPGLTGVTGGKTYANQFQNVADSTRDFRTKSGADLVDAGTTDSSFTPTDIVGTTRPQGTAYDIGAWELVQSAPGGHHGLTTTGAG